MDPTLIVAFVALGALVGFLAGLLGIGGGMTMVPLLTIVFSRQGFATEHVVHLAVATATATILFTSIASAREHHRHGAVLWRVVAGMAPGIVVGSLVGPQIVGTHVDAPARRVLRRVRGGVGHADTRRSQARADARAAGGAGSVRGGRRHRIDLEHGRRRRRVPVGAVHARVQREAA